MRIYQIKLSTYSGVITPFQVDTIFGHLCWTLAHLEGNQSLQRFLKPFKGGDPPFIISDGFPADLLPKPLSAEFNIDDPQERKEIRGIEYVSLDDFNCLRKSEKCKLRPIDELVIARTTTPHNAINRLTYTALAEGGVYSLEEISIPNVSIYLKVVSEEWKDKVVDLLKKLSKSGYGAKKSIGKGQFSVDSVEEFTKFGDLKNANGFVTLSNFCPKEQDPNEGFYRIFVKYGKLGEEFTFSGNPFKRPLVMIKSGSVFRTQGTPKEFYGRIIEDGIAPAKPEVIQYAYGFAVPVVIPVPKKE